MECIEWVGAKNHFGYGVKRWLGRNWLTHRLAWVLANEPIPDGLCVLHRCDNPPCVNVDHLFLGTRADNTADAIQKGRLNSFPGVARLTEADVNELRSSWKHSVWGDHWSERMAERYGVSRRTIDRAVRGDTWK